MTADYLSRNVVVTIKISDEDLTDKLNTGPLCITVKNILNPANLQKKILETS
jgi:hypothetical protein